MFLRRRHRLVRRIVIASAVAALAAPMAAQARIDPLGPADGSSFETPAARVAELHDPGTSTGSFETPVARVAELHDPSTGPAQAVVVARPGSEISSFDWTAAGIGLGAGAGLALVAGGLLVARRRFGPTPIA